MKPVFDDDNDDTNDDVPLISTGFLKRVYQTMEKIAPKNDPEALNPFNLWKRAFIFLTRAESNFGLTKTQYITHFALLNKKDRAYISQLYAPEYYFHETLEAAFNNLTNEYPLSVIHYFWRLGFKKFVEVLIQAIPLKRIEIMNNDSPDVSLPLFHFFQDTVENGNFRYLRDFVKRGFYAIHSYFPPQPPDEPLESSMLEKMISISTEDDDDDVRNIAKIFIEILSVLPKIDPNWQVIWYNRQQISSTENTETDRIPLLLACALHPNIAEAVLVILKRQPAFKSPQLLDGTILYYFIDTVADYVKNIHQEDIYMDEARELSAILQETINFLRFEYYGGVYFDNMFSIALKMYPYDKNRSYVYIARFTYALTIAMDDIEFLKTIYAKYNLASRKDIDGHTPLMHACSNSNLECAVKMVHYFGADVNQRSILYYVYGNGRDVLIGHIIHYGATALTLSLPIHTTGISKEYYTPVVRFLIDAGATYLHEMADEEKGETILMFLQRNNPPLYLELLEKGLTDFSPFAPIPLNEGIIFNSNNNNKRF